MRTTEGGRKRMEGAEERVDRFFEKLSEKMDDYGEKEAKRMRKDETLNGNLKSSSCAAASSEETTVFAGEGYEDMEWQEMTDGIKRKKKQSEDAEHEAKRQNVEDEINPEKMEVDIGEMDLIDEPDVWEKWDQYEEEEISFMMKLGVWIDASLDECLAKTGKPPISTRWVDVDKGTNGIVDIRSRLVARDFKIRGDGREFEVFAAMPPLEAKRLLFRMAVLDGSVHGGEEKGKVKLMFLDVKGLTLMAS